MSDQWADIEASDGTMTRIGIDDLHDTSQTVYAPRPGSLPEIGDLVLTTRIDDDPYYLIAGAWIGDDCRHAVQFDYAFDDDGSIVGAAALSRLGRDRTGFRIPKADVFRPEDPPSYSGEWSDYYVVFCINDAGEVVTADLVSSSNRVGTPA